MFVAEPGAPTLAPSLLTAYVNYRNKEKINTKTLKFYKYCKGLPVKASKQQKSFWG